MFYKTYSGQFAKVEEARVLTAAKLSDKEPGFVVRAVFGENVFILSRVYDTLEEAQRVLTKFACARPKPHTLSDDQFFFLNY